MGSTGAFIDTGGFREYKWSEAGIKHGIKILRKKTVGNERQSLPPFSNTPGTAYLLLNPDGSFKQFRQYGENRNAEFDIDYGKHGNEVSLHIHHYKNGHKKPTIIASKTKGIIDHSLYNKYKKILIGIKL